MPFVALPDPEELTISRRVAKRINASMMIWATNGTQVIVHRPALDNVAQSRPMNSKPLIKDALAELLPLEVNPKFSPFIRVV